MIKGIECVKVNGQVIYQQDTIGIQNNVEKTENTDKPLVIQCSRGD
jgi:hypothetical protein